MMSSSLSKKKKCEQTWPMHHTSMQSSLQTRAPLTHWRRGRGPCPGACERGRDAWTPSSTPGRYTTPQCEAACRCTTQQLADPSSTHPLEPPAAGGGRGPWPRTSKRTRGQMDSLVKTRPVHHTTPHHSQCHTTPRHVGAPQSSSLQTLALTRWSQRACFRRQGGCGRSCKGTGGVLHHMADTTLHVTMQG